MDGLQRGSAGAHGHDGCVFRDSAPQEEENQLRLYMRMGNKNLQTDRLRIDALRLLTTSGFRANVNGIPR